MPAKCLSCHDEIASESSEAADSTGQHRGLPDLPCRAPGPRRELIPLDTKDFDHAETGYILEGAHAKVTECGRCHYGKAAFRRTTGKSYLLRDVRCSVCHNSPHPGRQEDCLACHSMEGWRADGGPAVKWWDYDVTPGPLFLIRNGALLASFWGRATAQAAAPSPHYTYRTSVYFDWYGTAYAQGGGCLNQLGTRIKFELAKGPSRDWTSSSTSATGRTWPRGAPTSPPLQCRLTYDSPRSPFTFRRAR